MRPFAFRLATVLMLWQRREDAALVELHRQQAVHRVAVSHLDGLHEARAQASREARAGSQPATAPHDPAWHRNWIKHLSLAIDGARVELARCAGNERVAQIAWQRARRDRRVLERLRDRAFRRHQIDMRRHETKLLDELAGLRPRKGLTW